METEHCDIEIPRVLGEFIHLVRQVQVDAFDIPRGDPVALNREPCEYDPLANFGCNCSAIAQCFLIFPSLPSFFTFPAPIPNPAERLAGPGKEVLQL